MNRPDDGRVLTGKEPCPCCGSSDFEVTKFPGGSACYLGTVIHTKITCKSCGFSVQDEIARLVSVTWARYGEYGFTPSPFTLITPSNPEVKP